MSADILELPPQNAPVCGERFVWSCGCGNQAFFVYSDATIECVGCGAGQPGLRPKGLILWPGNER